MEREYRENIGAPESPDDSSRSEVTLIYHELIAKIDELKAQLEKLKIFRERLQSIEESEASEFDEIINTLESSIHSLAESLHFFYKESEKKYKEATLDALTGLLRRDEFKKILNQRLRRMKTAEGGKERETRTLGRGCLALIDLNNFKPINDKYGHAVGDIVISAVSKLAYDLRPTDLAMRYGGDEFVIYLSGSDPNVVGRLITRRINAMNPLKVAIPDNTSESGSRDQDFYIDFSIGVVPIPDNLPNPDDPETQERYHEIISELLKSADTMMYEAKQSAETYLDSNGESKKETTLAYIDNAGEKHLVPGKELFSRA